MRDYFRAAPTFWRRGTGRKLRGDKSAQILAWYLMVPPDGGLSGIYSISISTMADDTGLSQEEVREALLRFDKEDFAYYDESAECVWVVGTAKHQIPEGISSRKDNRWTSLVRELKQAGSQDFVRAFIETYGQRLSLTSDDVGRISFAVSKPVARLSKRASDPSEGSNMRFEDPSEGPDEDECTLPKGPSNVRGGNGIGRREGLGMGEGGTAPPAPPVVPSEPKPTVPSPSARPRDQHGDFEIGEAYRRGTEAAIAGPVAKLPRAEVQRLSVLADTHAPDQSLPGRASWAERAAFDYATAAKAAKRTRNVFKFGEWLENARVLGPGHEPEPPPLKVILPPKRAPTHDGTPEEIEAAKANLDAAMTELLGRRTFDAP